MCHPAASLSTQPYPNPQAPPAEGQPPTKTITANCGKITWGQRGLADRWNRRTAEVVKHEIEARKWTRKRWWRLKKAGNGGQRVQKSEYGGQVIQQQVENDSISSSAFFLSLYLCSTLCGVIITKLPLFFFPSPSLLLLTCGYEILFSLFRKKNKQKLKTSDRSRHLRSDITVTMLFYIIIFMQSIPSSSRWSNHR